MILPCETCLVRAVCFNRVKTVATVITERLFAGYLRSNCSILQQFYWKAINNASLSQIHPKEADKEFFNALVEQFKIKDKL
jgi:hypothetical protein